MTNDHAFRVIVCDTTETCRSILASQSATPKAFLETLSKAFAAPIKSGAPELSKAAERYHVSVLQAASATVSPMLQAIALSALGDRVPLVDVAQALG